MKDLYKFVNISRQAIWKYQRREAYNQDLILRCISIMKKLRIRHKQMGCRSMYDASKTAPPVGRDRFIEIGMANGYRLKHRRNKRKTTWAQTTDIYPNLIAGMTLTKINQVWQSDIFYHHENGKDYYGITIIDVYSRRLLALHLSRSLRAEENVKALQSAVKSRLGQKIEGCIFHSDRGSQYFSNIQKEEIFHHGLKISMCKIPQENAYAERVQETIQHYYLCDENLEGKPLKRVSAQILKKYNEERPHSGIDMMTPAAFEKHVENLPKRHRPKCLIFKWDHGLSTKSQLPTKRKK